MAQSYQLFIDGTWRDSSDGATIPAVNPYNQDVHATIPVATPAAMVAGEALITVSASPPTAETTGKVP